MPTVKWLAAGALAVAFGMALADEPTGAAPPAEARIVFSGRNIWNWQVIDNQTVLIETTSHKWYKAKLLSPCIDLPFAERVGFKSNADNSFDKFSAIEARGQRCPLVSLTETQAPAKKVKKKAAVSPPSAVDLGKP
jgi:hypothetical protein